MQVLQHQVLAQRVVGVLAHLPEEGVALSQIRDGQREAAQAEAIALLPRKRCPCSRASESRAAFFRALSGAGKRS